MMDISEIATIAHALKKPSKAVAFETLREIIDSGASENALAELYAYFLPPIPKTPKTPEQWVAKAVAHNHIWNHLHYMHSDGQYLVAADGHRLHRTPTTLEPGYYDTALTPVSETLAYPEFGAVLTHTGPEYPLIPQSLPVRCIVQGEHAYELPHGTLLNTRYVNDAAAGLESITVRLKDGRDSTGTSVMLIRPDGGVAIVMPIRERTV